MKYIFVSGAPGSKWSSVVKNIYYSPDIDSTDYSDERTYWHDASGTYDLMHLGVYWGPAMEFGDWFERLDQHSKAECEAEFDLPFSGSGVRIIKSHVFGYHIDYIKQTWPDCPVVLIDRSDDACLGWWVKCGEFKITYPAYRDYYKDLRSMAAAIAQENTGNRQAAQEYPGQVAETNRQLSRILGIAVPDNKYYQDYVKSDIKVTVI
jgi:hypothetical protein